MIRLLVAATAVAALSGCVANRRVEGVVSGTGEKFSGTVVGYGETTGSVEIVSQRTTCKGTFSGPPGGEAKGEFVCADGRKGPFTLQPGQRGVARFGSQAFIFTFS